MRYAVISDIHNNLPAFRAVLQDIETQNVDKICCLGDLLGYGPNPLECIELLLDLHDSKRLAFYIPGNHDQACMLDPQGFNPMAEKAILWTRKQLERESGGRNEKFTLFMYAKQVDRYKRMGDLLFVHGSPWHCLNEYVFEEDAENPDKMLKLFNAVKFTYRTKYSFMGHTHVPGVFVDNVVDGRYEYHSYKEIHEKFDDKFKLGGNALMINVGSVGQPRDYDPRSCYVILNYDQNGLDDYIRYRRVEYDVEETVKAFRNVEGLADLKFLWERIRIGR